MKPLTAYGLVLACCAAALFPSPSHAGHQAEIDIEAQAAFWLTGLGGHSVSPLADFDGDGTADILAGRYLRGGNSNRINIILGAPNLEGTIDLGSDADIVIASDSAYFGAAVGDVNGDSLSDLVVYGRYTTEPSDDLDAYLILGKPVAPPEMWTVPDDADVILRDVSGGSRVKPWGLRSGCDINGDDYCDLGVATDRYAVLFGSADMSGVVDVNSAEIILDLTPSGAITGWYAELLPDINGDGCDEIVMIGNDGTSWEARIWLGRTLTSAPITVTPDDAQIVLLPKIAGKYVIIRGGGDVSGDGIGDMLISLFSKYAGEAYIVFGQLGTEPRVVSMEDADVTFNHSSSEASDLRIGLAADAGYDGVADVLLEEWLPIVTYKSYLFAGGPSLGGTRALSEADLRFSGGYQPRAAEDFNGDGHNDFVFEKFCMPDSPQEFAGVFGPFLPAGCVQAESASGIPGQQDVPVKVYLESAKSVELAAMSFTLCYDDSVFLPPAEEDVSTGVEGMELTVDTSAPGEVRVQLTSSSGDNVSIERHAELALVNFDVAQVTPDTYDLIVESVTAEDQDGEAVALVAGPPATFTALLISPDNPVVYTEEYVNFRFTAMWLVDNPRYVCWSLPVADSGGRIRSSGAGLYQAGPTGGVVDQVMVQYEYLEGTTNVTVLDGSRPKGAAGPATTMDVDGGGVGLSDVLLILRYVVGMGTLDPAQQDAADFNCDGQIGLNDVINALRVVVGLEPTG